MKVIIEDTNEETFIIKETTATPTKTKNLLKSNTVKISRRELVESKDQKLVLTQKFVEEKLALKKSLKQEDQERRDREEKKRQQHIAEVRR